ncbi:DUF1289 domain-containing protein [Lampropedia puyangensis]|uniref:DUF1289 domain-containing protein n=1 Tax=Lampropedia puyangensis TaxID=1330072 RepID=A0A4S8F633_9BURK|nr:DUF1289 domain-containing protein [Lampropedia puyangensis]THU02888.1 DUF1289 domain-containing protein [Lampropedia puyangensis]
MLAKPLQANSRSCTEQSSIPSPCINVCTMQQIEAAQQELCLGCLRTLPEIVEWGSASRIRKQAIWSEVLVRITTVQAWSDGAQQPMEGSAMQSAMAKANAKEVK